MLVKLPQYTFVPAIRAVTALLQRTVCTPAPPPAVPPPSGRWVMQCDPVRVLVGTYTREDWEQGRCQFFEIGTPKYINGIPVCRSVWVPNG